MNIMEKTTELIATNRWNQEVVISALVLPLDKYVMAKCRGFDRLLIHGKTTLHCRYPKHGRQVEEYLVFRSDYK